MSEKKYQVFIDGNLVAQSMRLEYALLFVKAVFEEYYNDHNMEVMVKEMPQLVDEDEIWERNATM